MPAGSYSWKRTGEPSTSDMRDFRRFAADYRALLAKVTAGSSGAELAEMLNEGAIMAARGKRLEITHEDLFEGFLRVVAGPRKASSMLAFRLVS